MGRDNKTALRIERFLQGVTLRDLEAATGRSRMFFSRLENGGSAKLDPDTARKVAAVLDTSPEKLFSEDSNR